jgi:uncharacterized membrane protein YgdD (TMEM256/DUF423 family)
MNQSLTLKMAATLGALAVMVGAFGAHALAPTLENLGTKHIFELASRYHFYHVFALLATAILMQFFNDRRLTRAAICFALGILFFSGSLYTMALVKLGWLGPVTPVGGLFLIAGWILLGWSFFKKK